MRWGGGGVGGVMRQHRQQYFAKDIQKINKKITVLAEIDETSNQSYRPCGRSNIVIGKELTEKKEN